MHFLKLFVYVFHLYPGTDHLLASSVCVFFTRTKGIRKIETYYHGKFIIYSKQYLIKLELGDIKYKKLKMKENISKGVEAHFEVVKKLKRLVGRLS